MLGLVRIGHILPVILAFGSISFVRTQNTVELFSPTDDATVRNGECYLRYSTSRSSLRP